MKIYKTEFNLIKVIQLTNSKITEKIGLLFFQKVINANNQVVPLLEYAMATQNASNIREQFHLHRYDG